jgi:hypothetical protein
LQIIVNFRLFAAKKTVSRHWLTVIPVSFWRREGVSRLSLLERLPEDVVHFITLDDNDNSVTENLRTL